MKASEAIREVRFNMSKIGLSDKAAKRVDFGKKIPVFKKQDAGDQFPECKMH